MRCSLTRSALGEMKKETVLQQESQLEYCSIHTHIGSETHSLLLSSSRFVRTHTHMHTDPKNDKHTKIHTNILTHTHTHRHNLT